jgi:hypothetical protein
MLLTLVMISLAVLLFVGTAVIGVWYRQERMVYQAPAEVPTPPDGIPRTEYLAADGTRLYGYVIDPDHTPAGVLVAFHGNADLATWQIPWAREVARRTGWRVLLAEYRGYGGLAGAPSYEGVRGDARAAWRVACRQLSAPGSARALFGHSLGSAVAVELASEIDETGASGALAAVVLQSPFTSARDMARIVSSRPVELVWKLISRVHYDTRARLSTVRTPLWIAHGERDWLVPVAMGRELFATALRPGRLLVVAKAGHNDVDLVGAEAYWQWMSDALTSPAELPPAFRSGSTRRIGTRG